MADDRALRDDEALRLFPLPVRQLSAARHIYQDLDLPPLVPRDLSRPYTIINMVSSVDGKTTAQGGTAFRIGSWTDRQVMRNLRAKADAVMIGAGTLRAERLSLGLDDLARDTTQPIGVIVAGSDELQLQNLIVKERQEILVLAPEGSTGGGSSPLLDNVVITRPSSTSGEGVVDLGEALEMLKIERDVDLLLVEGGPKLNHALVSHNQADEVFLTLSPRLLGGTAGEALTMLDGLRLPENRGSLDLASVHLAGGEIFLRYKVAVDEQL